MKIESLNFKDNEFGNGLKEIKMTRIPQIILLTGPNGGGKTRLLNILKEKLGTYPTDLWVNQNEANKRIWESNISSLKSKLQTASSNSEKQQIENSLKPLKEALDNYNSQLALREKIKLDICNPVVVHFVPQNTNLKDPLACSVHDWKRHSDTLRNNLGHNKWEESVPAYIQQIVQEYMAAKSGSNSNNSTAIKDYNELNNLILLFLGRKIEVNSEGYASIFDFPIGKAKLSQGQSVLLQLAVAIFAQGAKLDNLILLLDELESHLHPSVSIQVISKIIEKVPLGQIWIATHSLSILSAFFDENIWYMDKGEITWVGRKIEKVLEGLIGKKNNDKLRAFIDLPHEFAIKRFAAECLRTPKSTITGSEDPQMMQIIAQTRASLTTLATFKILDYGAGKGRVIQSLRESHIDYVAYDAYSEDEGICRANIAEVYDSHENRYFNDLRILKEQHGEKTFDVVIFCNVFHEISPVEWEHVIGEVRLLLKPEGYLLMLEDNCMPHGERAHEYGFIVLDTLSLRKLFCVSDEPDKIKSNSLNNRLGIHLISANILSQITKESKKQALEEVRKRAKEEMRKIQNSPKSSNSFSLGTQYAFWSQQFTNATLALESSS